MKIEKMFPKLYEILYEDKNKNRRKPGGFRNGGKSRIYWSKAYKSKNKDLSGFFP